MSNESMKKTSEKQSVTCHYDGLGKRRIKAVGDETHYWRWDAGYSVVAEYKDQTPDWDVGALQRFFVPFGHTALAEATPGAGDSVANGTYTYLAHDHLGTSRKGYNQSQTEVHSNEHLPFGQRFSTTGTVPYHEWTGKPWDADTQMYYFPYRYYSPMMNRWTAADPLGMVDGTNIYGYVRGNPISHVDPMGLFSLSTFLEVEAIYSCLRDATGLWDSEKIKRLHRCIEPDLCNPDDLNCTNACICFWNVCGGKKSSFIASCVNACVGTPRVLGCSGERDTSDSRENLLDCFLILSLVCLLAVRARKRKRMR